MATKSSFNQEKMAAQQNPDSTEALKSDDERSQDQRRMSWEKPSSPDPKVVSPTFAASHGSPQIMAQTPPPSSLPPVTPTRKSGGTIPKEINLVGSSKQDVAASSYIPFDRIGIPGAFSFEPTAPEGSSSAAGSNDTAVVSTGVSCSFSEFPIGSSTNDIIRVERGIVIDNSANDDEGERSSESLACIGGEIGATESTMKLGTISPFSAFVVNHNHQHGDTDTSRERSDDNHRDRQDVDRLIMTENESRRLRERAVGNVPVVKGQNFVDIHKKGGRMTDKGFCRRNPKMIAVTASLLCVILVVVVVPTAVVFSNKSLTDDTVPGFDGLPTDTQAPSTPYPTSERYMTIRNILEQYTSSATFDDRTSPQHRALVWLSDNDGMAVNTSFERRLIQRYALATFFFATGGGDVRTWKQQIKFLSQKDECDWNEEDPENENSNFPFKGAFCLFSENEIDLLVIPSNNLTGTIVSEIGLLSKLSFLGLYSNKLSGSIPSSLSRLENLKDVHLYDNSLVGAIPNSITLLSRLKTLLLMNNKLTGSIPEEIGMLNRLREFRVNKNNMNGTIPKSFRNMTKLRKLYLYENSFSGSLPSELGQLQRLQILYTYSNRLNSTIPSEIGKLTELTELSIAFNNITGTLPSSINNLSKLETLFVSKNRLQGTISFDPASFPVLRNLFAWSNAFSGTIPDGIYNYSSLEFIDLSWNRINGTLSQNISKLSNLKGLYLIQNQLRGIIPSSLGGLTKLEQLYLGENKFTKTIPSELGNLTLMRELMLYNNSLTGTVPATLAQLTNLELLDLGNNSFSGGLDFFCDAGMRFYMFRSDCYGKEPEVTCECCTACCSDTVMSKEFFDCFAMD